jgi:hypothetical protein
VTRYCQQVRDWVNGGQQPGEQPGAHALRAVLLMERGRQTMGECSRLTCCCCWGGVGGAPAAHRATMQRHSLQH